MQPDGREWLVTNGLGGFASGTLAGGNVRRYHGLLTAALPPPSGRFMLLDEVQAGVLSQEMPTVVKPLVVRDFKLEQGLPVWCLRHEEAWVERRLFMPHRRNTVHLLYHLHSGGPLRLQFRLFVHFRSYHADPGGDPGHYQVRGETDQWEIDRFPAGPVLRINLTGARAEFILQAEEQGRDYPEDAARGFHARGRVWSPGVVRVTLGTGEWFGLTASTESWSDIRALEPEEALTHERKRRTSMQPPGVDSIEAQLRLAADQFLVRPADSNPAGRESVIAGYPWFTDWGRDTMISLEGLTLATGRCRDAGWILKNFSRYFQDGLIPNCFSNGANQPVYHSADATLWYFHALDRYLSITSDRKMLRNLLPNLVDVLQRQHQGTRFNIQADPKDGLLRQGESGYALTWMDAKVHDRAVTPRAGKGVEINALWYNALCLLVSWLEEEDAGSAALRVVREWAQQAKVSFNQRFWFSEGGYLYDVVDGPGGDDASCRPNQLLAIALKHAVLDPRRWEPVVAAAEQRLLTPVGLRSLAPGQPDYHPQYLGDASGRDAAYHQGTVWAWLIGPFIDAWLKLHPQDAPRARRFLLGFARHLQEAGVGSISEIFDAEAPFAPRGCIAQAWSVAEVLRCWQKTAASSQ
jgi:glycogen debranching enzyme